MICRTRNGESSGDFRSTLAPEVPFFSTDTLPLRAFPQPTIITHTSPELTAGFCSFSRAQLHLGKIDSRKEGHTNTKPWQKQASGIIAQVSQTQMEKRLTETLGKSFVVKSQLLSVLSDQQEKHYPQQSTTSLVCPAKISD